MARAKRVSSENLATLVSQFFSDKKNADEFKKKAETANNKIKELMAADKSLLVEDDKKKDVHIFRTNGLIAEYYVQQRKSMNEEALLAFLKEKAYDDIIETVEQVNMDKLESAIYNGKIEAEDIKEMRKFENIKEVPTLTVKADKEA